MNSIDSMPLMVTIRCITYNHEPYIRQCLEGFVMQKTNFRFEAIVHDDASTDGTADIIREYAERYPDIIKPIYEVENQYSKRDGSLRRIMDEHTHGKYVALCEGDDYWIDPNKLQVQVDFLENNIDYGLTYTTVNVFNEQEQIITGQWGRSADAIVLFKELPIPTLSIVCRRSLYDKYRKEIPADKWLMGDIPLCSYFANESKIKHLNIVTGMYRVLEKSASHLKDFDATIKLMMSVYDCKLYFDNRYYNGSFAGVITKDHFNELYKRSLYFNRAFNMKYWKYLNKYRAWDFKIFIKYMIVNTCFGRQFLLKRYKIKGIKFNNNQ